MTNTIYELAGLIRDRINNPIKQSGLIKNTEKWNMLCSSLDVSADTQYTIEYYLTSNFSEDLGGRYLYIYGLLQACYVQQDAISSMYKALYDKVINFESDYPDLHKIRELRNMAIGHPTIRKDRSSHFISQHSIQKEGFQIMSAYKDGSDVFTDVNVVKVIDQQSNGVKDILKVIIAKLDLDISQFKGKYSLNKLAVFFSKPLNYDFEKLYDLAFKIDSPIPRISIERLSGLKNKIREELEQRYGSLVAFNGIIECYKEIDYLIDYLYGVIEGNIDRDEMLIRFLIECLEKRFNDLKEMCIEIDGEMRI